LIRGGGLVSRLAAALAQRERPPETLLDLRHKTRRTERPADQLSSIRLKGTKAAAASPSSKSAILPTKNCSDCETFR